MKIYNSKNELVNYDKSMGRLDIKRTVIAECETYKQIPDEYRDSDEYKVYLADGKWVVFHREGFVIPYSTEELNKLYEKEVERLIREKYTIGQELAILRQRDVKTDEFNTYNAFAEECKNKAKTLYKGV